MRTRPITIKDIAAHLGMSHSTVSRALNDHAHINEKTKKKVAEAARELGYVPNLSARIMRGDYDKLVGLLIPDIQNDFYSRIARDLGARCRKEGLRLLLAVSEDDPEIEEQELRGLIEARVSGVVATLTSKPTAASKTLLEQVASVQLVRRDPKLKRPAVCMDDIDGCRVATEHLLDQGHVRIAYVGTSKTITAGKDRLTGFLSAYERRGIEPAKEGVVLVPPRQEYGYDAVADVLALQDRPTAIVIGSSELTIGGMQAIRDAHLNIPNDISVVGYGDPVWFELLNPSLTAVSLPFNALADASIDELLALMEHGDNEVAEAAKRCKLIRVPTSLVVRQSTAAPRLKPMSKRRAG